MPASTPRNGFLPPKNNGPNSPNAPAKPRVISPGEQLEIDMADDAKILNRLTLAIDSLDHHMPSVVAFAEEQHQTPGMAETTEHIPEHVAKAFHRSLIAAADFITHSFALPKPEASVPDQP